MHWKELKVWQKSHALVLIIYNLTRTFPKEETYALTSQIRRAGVSVPSNIVEGHSRKTPKEYAQFLFNARGSLEEARYYFLLAKDLGYISGENYNDLESRGEEISRMLNSLIAKIKTVSR